jgi:hypothetical protein
MSVAARQTKSPAQTALEGTAAGGGNEFALAYGPETMDTEVFGRLTAWQNWIFTRPNACGPDGALRRFGTGRKGDDDYRRL